MCGIAGYWGVKPPPDEAIAATLELMKRRGPDHQEAWSADAAGGRKVCLLHARLSIIDLDAALESAFYDRQHDYRFQRRDLQLRGAAREAAWRATSSSARAPTPRCCCIIIASTARTASATSRGCGASRSTTATRQACVLVAGPICREAAVPASCISRNLFRLGGEVPRRPGEDVFAARTSSRSSATSRSVTRRSTRLRARSSTASKSSATRRI